MGCIILIGLQGPKVCVNLAEIGELIKRPIKLLYKQGGREKENHNPR